MRLNARDITCALLKRRKLVSIAEQLALAAAGENKARKWKTSKVEKKTKKLADSHHASPGVRCRGSSALSRRISGTLCWAAVLWSVLYFLICLCLKPIALRSGVDGNPSAN